MLVSGVFTNSRQATATDGLQGHATGDARGLELRQPGAPCRDSAGSLSQACAIASDWWPLLVAGVAIALLL